MRFFEHQRLARRQTRILVLLFILALAAIVVAVNLVAALFWIWMQGKGLRGPHAFPQWFFITNTAITAGLILGGTLIELFNLREGGDVVARMAGGRPLQPGTRNLREQRLQNVVAEMALASGIKCPVVYLLNQEQSINAFAAGYDPDQAVVVLTQGALDRLTRDELQGVVAHEFSHILNGDMRLNVRIIGVLFGIQMIAGFGEHLIGSARNFAFATRREERSPPFKVLLLALGVALFVTGYIGVIFGRMIRAGVSRQREFLADASAVQFTRNPDGIGGALRKIGGLGRRGTPGSHIQHHNAEQLSHLFLGAPRSGLVSGLMASHPPIRERLRRIYGKNVHFLPAPELPPEAPVSRVLPDIPYPGRDSRR